MIDNNDPDILAEIENVLSQYDGIHAGVAALAMQAVIDLASHYKIPLKDAINMTGQHK